MLTVPGKLSQQSFKKILSGSNGFIPKEITKELKSAGMSRILHSDSISRHKAMKAINHLQKEGYIPKSKNATSTYREAGLKQAEMDEIARLDNQKKMGRLHIAMELEDDGKRYNRQGGKDIEYDDRSAMGGISVINKLDKDKDKRDTKAKEEKEKINKFKNKQGIKADKPTLVDIDKLPDMNIG